MTKIARLAVALLIGVVLSLVSTDAFPAPVTKSAEIVAVPDSPQGRAAETATRFHGRQEEPKKEGLHKLGEVPKKFAFAAGVAWDWLWFLAKLALFGFVVLIVVYFVRARKDVKKTGRDEDLVESLAASVRLAVKRVRNKRKELQAKVGILDKAEDAIATKKSAPKRKAKPRARKTT